jgi:CheY-like chemotaxis protein
MKRILVVDDDRDFVVSLAMLLRRHGYNVVTAADAVSAIAVAMKETPQAALIDVRLPGGDGIVVMERLHAQPRLAGLPVVILTGGDAEKYRERALAAGAKAFLTKPIAEDRLLAALAGMETVGEVQEGEGHTVLIVDDDQDLLFALSVLLRGRGYQVVAAADGVSAISVAVKHRPDVVLLDIGLPGGEGFTVMDRLRGLPKLAAVPVVILSGLDPERQRERALAAGAVEYLTKPAAEDVLLAAVRRALETGGR